MSAVTFASSTLVDTEPATPTWPETATPADSVLIVALDCALTVTSVASIFPPSIYAATFSPFCAPPIRLTASATPTPVFDDAATAPASDSIAEVSEAVILKLFVKDGVLVVNTNGSFSELPVM